ncbi:hypothetical protein MVEN_00612000 [Mycena venus]|uniref:Phosphatidic acid phosphatase type 2/haloperoxidase domain-containing protein n=1 Tax=Mycena venus TaxID=2733690 RepID=A0A8H6YRI3_9AGAR|nr:hypothetical protein MVEN_00612000 [Mycena venus]
MATARVSPNPVTATSKSKLLVSYVPDWIITLALAAVFFSLDVVHGFRRQFSLTDTSLRHTYAVHERIPNLALYMIAVVAPAVLQAVINVATIRSWWDLHNSLLGLILGLSITGAVTQFTKITVGSPRPDLIDRCQPVAGSVDPVYGLSNYTICTSPVDSSIMLDGFRSFPSGHSSLSFAGLGFLAFYLAGKLHLFDQRGYAFKAWISLAPFAGAALVAISRTMDYRRESQHFFIKSASADDPFRSSYVTSDHWLDVVAGSILGTVVAYFTYRQYYPSLASEVSHRPYSPRSARATEANERFAHHRRASSGASYRDINERPTTEDIVDSGPLQGTVLRDGPGSLREVWRDGGNRVRARHCSRPRTFRLNRCRKGDKCLLTVYCVDEIVKLSTGLNFPDEINKANLSGTAVAFKLNSESKVSTGSGP